jgi:hypothetical protein
LQDLFPACGGAVSTANVKILLRYEWIAGRLEPLAVLAGKRSDQGRALQAAERLQANELQLQDKGFYDGKAWQAAQQRGAFLLMPLPRSRTIWLAPAPDQPEVLLDLASVLATSLADRVAGSGLQVGQKGHRTGPLRLVAFRLSPESAGRQRRGLRENLRQQGRTPPAQALQLAGWLLLLTNAPADKLPDEMMSYCVSSALASGIDLSPSQVGPAVGPNGKRQSLPGAIGNLGALDLRRAALFVARPCQRRRLAPLSM